MKRLLCPGLLLALCLGCSKNEPAPVATEAPAETPPTTQRPAPNPAASPRPAQQPAYTPPPAAPKAQPQPVARLKPIEGRVDAHMTALLNKFVAQKGRMPESILELAGATSDSFPLAPAGYLYAIDPATAQVKLVKQ